MTALLLSAFLLAAQVSFEARPTQEAVMGQPIRLLVGIKNLGPTPLVFAPPAGSWVSSTSYCRDDPKHPASGECGGSAGALSHQIRQGERWCPSEGDDVLLLPPGSQVFRLLAVTIGPKVAGKIKLTTVLRLLRAKPDLSCAPAEFIEGTVETPIEIKQR